MDNREKAKRLYLGGKTLDEVATNLGVKPATVRKWKQRDSWPERVTKKASQKKRRVTVTKPQALIPYPLTDKEQLFCEIYANIYNATVAYMKAYGVSHSSARTAGPRLLQNVAVRTYVNYLKSIKAQMIMADINDLVELHMAIAFADYCDYVDFGVEERPTIDHGTPVMVETADGSYAMLTHKVNYVQLKNADEVDGRIIAEVKTSKDGTSVKLADRNASLKWLSEHFMANPMDKHRAEYDRCRQQLERERFEYQKKRDKENDF